MSTKTGQQLSHFRQHVRNNVHRLPEHYETMSRLASFKNILIKQVSLINSIHRFIRYFASVSQVSHIGNYCILMFTGIGRFHAAAKSTTSAPALYPRMQVLVAYTVSYDSF